MKKRIYKAPVMELVRVHLEQGFMKASIFEPGQEQGGVTIDGHEVAGEYDYSAPAIGGEDNGWD